MIGFWFCSFAVLLKTSCISACDGGAILELGICAIGLVFFFVYSDVWVQRSQCHITVGRAFLALVLALTKD